MAYKGVIKHGEDIRDKILDAIIGYRRLAVPCRSVSWGRGRSRRDTWREKQNAKILKQGMRFC